MNKAPVGLAALWLFAGVVYAEERARVVCEKPDPYLKVPMFTSPGGSWIMENLSCGQELTLLGTERGFCRVRVAGHVGYVAAAFVASDAASNGPSPPANATAPGGTPRLPGSQYTIRPGGTIYIEKMNHDLDTLIRAEFVKQKVPLHVVLSPADAEYILSGSAAGTEERKWHEGWLTLEKDKAVGNVMVVDVATRSMVWAGEAGDRDLWLGALVPGGTRKVAARIVGKMRDAIK